MCKFSKKYYRWSEPSAYEVNIALEKIKRNKSPGIDQISAELFIAGDRKILSEITQIINSIWNKNEMPEEWKESIIAPILKKGDKTECSSYRGLLYLSNTYKILSNILLSKFTPNTEVYIGEHECGFRRSRSATDHIYFTFVKCMRKNGNTINTCNSNT